MSLQHLVDSCHLLLPLPPSTDHQCSTCANPISPVLWDIPPEQWFSVLAAYLDHLGEFFQKSWSLASPQRWDWVILRHPNVCKVPPADSNMEAGLATTGIICLLNKVSIFLKFIYFFSVISTCNTGREPPSPRSRVAGFSSWASRAPLEQSV